MKYLFGFHIRLQNSQSSVAQGPQNLFFVFFGFVSVSVFLCVCFFFLVFCSNNLNSRIVQEWCVRCKTVVHTVHWPKAYIASITQNCCDRNGFRSFLYTVSIQFYKVELQIIVTGLKNNKYSLSVFPAHLQTILDW